MHILHVNSYYSNRFFYKHLFDRQVDRGYELDVYVPIAEETIIRKKDLGNYTLVSKNHGKYDRFIFHLKHNKIVSDIQQQYDFEKVNLVHAHSLFSNGYVANELYKKYGIPYIVAVRMPDIYTFFRLMIHLRNTGIEIMENASKIIFLSESFRDLLLEKYVPENLKESIKEKSHIIPNGVAPYWLENKGKMKSVDGHSVKLLQVGQISKLKNPLMSIEAMEELRNRGYEVRLTFVGETIVGETIDKELRQEMTKNENIEYISRVEKEKLKDIYRAHDIFILPSLRETFGLVYVEAMSQGLPVIYSAGQGFDKYYNEGEVGYSIDNKDPRDIADKVEETIKNYETISQNGIEYSEDFDWDRIEEKYHEVYLDVLNPPRA